MKIQSMYRNFSLVALALALATGTSIGFAQTADSETISNLLKQARGHAVLAEKDAEILESYTRSHATWQSHGAQLNRIKEHVNELGQLNKQLSVARRGVSLAAEGNRPDRPATPRIGGLA
jgi:Tfp pilus assembly protein FimT